MRSVSWLLVALAARASADPPPRTFGGEDLTGESTAGVTVTAGSRDDVNDRLPAHLLAGDGGPAQIALIVEPAVQVALAPQLDAFARITAIAVSADGAHGGLPSVTLGLRERYAPDPCWTAAITASATLHAPDQADLASRYAPAAAAFLEDDLRANGLVAGRFGADLAWHRGLFAAQAHLEGALAGANTFRILTARAAAAAGIARDGLALLAEVSTRIGDRFSSDLGSGVHTVIDGPEPPDLGLTLRSDRGRIRSALHLIAPLESERGAFGIAGQLLVTLP